MLRAFRRDWLSNTRGDLLSGLVVAIALIPEAIDLTIMGAHGHSRIRQFSVGFQTTRMLANSMKPVLLLR